MARVKGGGVYSREKQIVEFWKRVTVKRKNECWEFNAFSIRTSKNGFKKNGAVWIDGKNISAHRFSFQLENGPIPEGLEVCHSCDNPPCVNPNHLFLGNQSINMLDMVKKGRNKHKKGEKHPRAKLTEKQVLDIRKDARGAIKLSRIYDVGISTITQVKKRLTWKHL